MATTTSTTAATELFRQTITPDVVLMRKQLDKLRRDMEVIMYTFAATRECYEPERMCHECLGRTRAPSSIGFDDEGTDDGELKERREFDELMEQITALQQQVALQTEASKQLRSENEQLQAECAMLQEQHHTDPEDSPVATPLKLSDAEVARILQLTKDQSQELETLHARIEEVTIERDHLRQERDTALLSAQKAWKENATLAGHANPGQKIKYVQQLKDENNKLHQQLRDAEARLALQAKRQVKSNYALNEWSDNGSSASAEVSERTMKPSKVPRKKALGRTSSRKDTLNDVISPATTANSSP
ncbi:hypothetical protein Ae201684P_018278 [Aphanomyces euteiches]|uniref:Hyaluronan-mediated motility receptor C-terminal domain-containing protein n=1 Tax=Aphanomyces euteiches TaxID=100861 RepID=A0A6G0XV72_9STRA|nr:hypothetical protein Ae201684_000837 [Aphanomyces euteiches]KAH9099261.1 hypothetical protein Ae201684P_018278 [Aphanomyces euteiches]KAH9146123.1 hypothetical protein AeRB84_010003 [Aphanomyces euteiches]